MSLCPWPTGLPEVTWPRRVFPWVCTCATGSYAISILVGPFYRKWRYKRHSVVTACHVTSFGVPLGACMRNRKLRNIRPSGAFWPEVCSLGLSRQISSMVTGTSPFIGYLPLLFSYNIIYFNKFSPMVFSDRLCSTPSSLSRRHCIFIIFSDILTFFFYPFL